MASTRRGGGGGAAIAAAAEELRAMANGGHHKTVMITRVGRGLGRALAIEMARRGHTVFGFSRDFYDLESLGLILYSDPDHRRVLFHLNVRDDEAISLFAHNAIGLVGAPDIIGLINQALSFMAELLRLATYDLAELQIEGDGNCQFRALADQLFRNPEHHNCLCCGHITYMALRIAMFTN